MHPLVGVVLVTGIFIAPVLLITHWRVLRFLSVVNPSYFWRTLKGKPDQYLKAVSAVARVPFWAISIGIGIFAGFEQYGKPWIVLLTSFIVVIPVGWIAWRKLQKAKLQITQDSLPPVKRP